MDRRKFSPSIFLLALIVSVVFWIGIAVRVVL